MQRSTFFAFLLGSLSAFAGCSSDPESLGVKGGNTNGQSQCEGPNPATLGCGNGVECPSGMVCDPTACHSSHCSCDEATGGWQCTADCGTPTCVPGDQGPTCEARNPSLGCSGGCPTGTVCNPDACAPSSCTCNENGEWACTRDCGGRGACVAPQEPKECTGPNPAMGCANDAACPSGMVCDPAACKSSVCSCDTTLGAWQCTADCGFGGACVAEGTQQCKDAWYIGPRAPEGDALCVGKPDCASSGGQPDHLGCPNTCSCICIRGACFRGPCTAIGGCTEPDVYR